MPAPARKNWSLDEFFAWQGQQDQRYGLVNGEPLRMQSGVSGAHLRVSMNILGQLIRQLRGKQCQPFHGDWSVQTKPGQLRRPDIGVDCGPFDPKSYKAASPVIIAEILSPTTRDFDTLRKSEEYKLIPSLRRILLVDPNRAEVFMWLRGEAGEWHFSTIAGLDAELSMPEIGVVLPLADIYDGIELPTELKLVGQE